MSSYIVYFDETGDDGNSTASSDAFILTSVYMPMGTWQENYDIVRAFRKELKEKYGFHVTEEMHTKHFLSDKDPYRKYGWSNQVRRDILIAFSKMMKELDISIVNTIIDKTIIRKPDYPILENALKYNIQRIDNDSNGEWNYIIISDKGRLAPMRKTARAIRAFNPIHSKFSNGYINQPVKNLIEDILEKDSKESYFIQLCDFISYFTHLYYKIEYKGGKIPNRVGRLIDREFIGRIMATFKDAGIINLKANPQDKYGLVIYPRT